ncbi:type 2 lantipeptide synthetase LanM [Staphylococcus gallinarum]|uniref:Type 2 lantipeptide synthetase LanM n=1 Tax=Staphylococcus gallinarum TaxID=1293 RepID=A0A418HKW7_STAGA|nr:type 2 lanthipeptide synthetase LanM family protein [Staphylococcus gallinarum]RIL41016.1 type 2 lantipeptide synthetase LanM [Staphylococcus gallinarum]RIO92924.1 type 2 lantipeptide synthetase LanM [Staphylococcus gallinarum]
MESVSPLKRAAYSDEISKISVLKNENSLKDGLKNWLEQSGLSKYDFEKKLCEKGISKDKFLEIIHSEPPTKLNFQNKWDEKIIYILNNFKGCKYTGDYILNSFATPFSQYFREEIRKFCERFIDIHIYFSDIENIIINLAERLNNQLTNVCTQTLIWNFYDFEKENDLSFFDYLLVHLNNNENKYKLLEKVPVLARNIVEITENHITYIKEIIERYIIDYIDIRKEFFEGKIVKLDSINIGQGDTHKSGRSVAILNFQNNEKLVYKPRSLSIDIGYNEFLKWLNTKEIKHKIKIITSINKKHYGWQRYVENDECQTNEQVEHYYYRMGVLIGVLFTLNSTDMHYENIIANGEFPEIVDLETIISNNIYHSSEDNFTLKTILNTILGSGVTNTGNLFSENIDTDISALTGIPKQKSKKIKNSIIKYSEDGNPELDFKYFETKEQKNLVKVNGEWMNPFDYIESLKNGLSDYLNIVEKEKKYLIDEIIDFCFYDSFIRIVPRASQTYSSFLNASYHPKYLMSGIDKEFLYELLWNVCTQEPKMKKLVNSEVIDLLNNDIPYFFTKTNSLDLYNSKNLNLGCLYTKTALEIIKEKVNQMDRKSITIQLKLLELSLIDFKNKKMTINEVEKMGDITTRCKTNNYELEIGNYIYKYALVDQKRITWIGWFSDSSINKFSLSSANYTMYNGSVGISLFLLELGRYYNNKKYEAMSLNVAQFLISEAFNKEKFLTVSSINGLGAIVYLSLYIYSITGNDWYYHQGVRLMENLNNYNKDKIATKDYMNGHAGIIHLLSNIYKKFNIERARSIACIYADHLSSYIYNHTSHFIDSLISNGIAHGISGYRIAFENINSIENDKYRKIIKYLDEIEIEKTSLYNEGNNHIGYWCNGNLGMIYEKSYRESLNSVGETKVDSNIVNESKKEILNMERICLCHGSFGNLNLLISLNKLNPTLIDIEVIRKTRDRLLRSEEIRKKINYQMETGQFGLFIGIAGIGYTLLRTKNPSIPDIVHFNFPIEEDEVKNEKNTIY